MAPETQPIILGEGLWFSHLKINLLPKEAMSFGRLAPNLSGLLWRSRFVKSMRPSVWKCYEIQKVITPNTSSLSGLLDGEQLQ